MDFRERLEHRMFYSHAGPTDAGISLLDYLASHFSRFDRTGWTAAIISGNVSINGIKAAAPETPLRDHDRITFFPGDLAEPAADLTCSTVYEDDDLIVFNKSGDLCVHPTGPFFKNTLWHIAGSRYGELRFVNRLDRETSGLLIAVKNSSTAAKMTNGACPFMRKEYLAVVFGNFTGTLRAKGYLVKDSSSAVFKKKHFVERETPPAQEAETADTEITAVTPVGNDMTLVRAVPHTGRQHQIRATLFSLGYPLAGDKLYGPDERIFLKIKTQSFSDSDAALLRMKRQALHSASLTFAHPVTGKEIHCEAPLPEDMIRLAASAL